MGQHCMVISGEWRCSPDVKWGFLIDKQRMSRVVTFQDGMSIEELKNNVFREFFPDGVCAMSVDISYWPPNTNELATGITTPPVMVTSAPSISYFCQHHSVKCSMNLFATFVNRPTSTPFPDVGLPPDAYTTPKPSMKRSRFSDDIGGEGRFGVGIANSADNGSSVGSRKPPADFDDEVLVRHMERVENVLGSGSHTKKDLYDLNTYSEQSVQESMDDISSGIGARDDRFNNPNTSLGGSVLNDVDKMASGPAGKDFPFEPPNTRPGTRVQDTLDDIMGHGKEHGYNSANLQTRSGNPVQDAMDELIQELSGNDYNSDDLNTDDEDNGEQDWESFDVRPLGIDEEFWEPLVDEVYGGSDAPDFMCDQDGPPIDVPPTVYRCSTNNAFDHTVVAGGDGGVWKTESMPGASTSSAPGGTHHDGTNSSKETSDSQFTMDGGNAGFPGNCGHTRASAQTNTPGKGMNTPNGGRTSNTSGNTAYPHGPQGMDSGNDDPTRSHRTCGPENTLPARTTLGEIDDEEFDIPPLFDDTQYENAEIPDLEIDELGGEVVVGKVYSSKKDCQVALAIYAIKGMFNFRQTTTKSNYFVLNCTDQRCDWRILAVQVKNCGYYEIKKANLHHTCCIETRSLFKKKASSRFIADVFKAKYGDPVKGPRAADLQQLVLEELRVAASYMQCYRAREEAITFVRGTDDDSYPGLPEYLYMLKLANPGTVTNLVTEKDVFGVDRFLYFFLSFGASIRGFRRLRHVIVIDGTHLGGKFMGTLLTASGQDANFQVFPLAYAVVDSENNDSWTWFMEKLERILADSSSLTIISDRCPSIKVAKAKIYPKAHHAACIVHLARNVTARYKSKGLAKMVVSAAFQYQVGGFRKIYHDIRAASPDCARYLHKMGIAHWSRAHFPGERYNLMTSNAAEQLNKVLRGGRNSPILELLKFIQDMMTRWFNARRKKSLKHTGMCTPAVDKVLTANMEACKGSKINMVSSWAVQIVGRFGEKHQVSLRERICLQICSKSVSCLLTPTGRQGGLKKQEFHPPEKSQ
ncbi:unnamed protein product [Microthlaspi erraticum]|uniref:Transposase MuDR plant domain-containing protein n=1 Tax=Microthlaspi erraticum TaxID=1685480 RepID=A0A6D2KTH4_9BRAS|nr:unnamed protein product [Microthlaspi erraticum]